MYRTGLRAYRIVGIAALGLILTASCAPRGAKRPGVSAPGAAAAPAMAWSTWIGGGDEEVANAIAVDAEGNAYVTGATKSPGWPEGGFDVTHNGGEDAFVVKIRKDGTMAWSTYLGGMADDSGSGIAVDPEGNVYVVGQTKSPGWVGESGSDPSLAHQGRTDAFVVAISADGKKMLWSACIGGPEDEVGYGIAVDRSQNVWVTGATRALDFKTAFQPAAATPALAPPDAPKPAPRILPNVFVSKLRRGTVEWSVVMGGDKEDTGRGVGVDDAGNAYVSGWTDSETWTVNGGCAIEHRGGRDGFVAKISPAGKVAWVACLGGAGSEMIYAIAVDARGYSHVAGRTNSSGWFQGGFDTDQNGPFDALVARISPTGKVVWSTCLGGSRFDLSRAIAIDDAGDVYVAGLSDSSDPWLKGGPDLTYAGDKDAFAAKIARDGSRLIWGSFLGGKGEDLGYAVGVDNRGGVYVAGKSQDSDWVSGGYDTTYNGGKFDAYAAKIRE